MEDESCLAVGAADGSIVVVRQKTLSKVLVMPCHEFPVTGMGFSPKSFGLNGADGSQILVTCSADNAMAVTYSKLEYHIHVHTFCNSGFTDNGSFYHLLSLADGAFKYRSGQSVEKQLILLAFSA